MQAARAEQEQRVDTATAIALAMRKLGVAGLPRNYEIFYEALTGANPELSIAVASLGPRPTQDELDAIGCRFFTENHSQSIVENTRETLARELEEIAGLLRTGRSHIERYGVLLDQTSSGLDGRQFMSKELLQKIVSAVSVATAVTLDHGRQIASSLENKTAELETVKSKLEEYKRLADTDPLTEIWNRRAFDRKIAQIYNSSKDVTFSALILADIDRFKEINDRFGHPVGDRIIQAIAGILRSSVREGTFVARTGGEEFALIVEGLSADATYELAERLRLLIEQTPFANSHSGIGRCAVTVSMGLCMASDADGPDDLYAKADRALYRSKVDGRNRVSRHSSTSGHASKNWLLYRKD